MSKPEAERANGRIYFLFRKSSAILSRRLNNYLRATYRNAHRAFGVKRRAPLDDTEFLITARGTKSHFSIPIERSFEF